MDHTSEINNNIASAYLKMLGLDNTENNTEVENLTESASMKNSINQYYYQDSKGVVQAVGSKDAMRKMNIKQAKDGNKGGSFSMNLKKYKVGDQIKESVHHEKDDDGNTIPHDDEINEDNTNDKSDDGDGMDKVQPKALKKKFKDRKDKDVDNDGDEDESDEYLHNRRKTVSKAIDKDDESNEPVAKTDRRKKLDKKDGDADIEKQEGYGKKMKKESTDIELDEKMDVKQKDRLDDLLNDLSYGHSSYPYDDNAPDPDRVQGMIRKEFGSKIADQVKAYYDKKGSKTGQKVSRQKDDSLKRTPTRVSKSGKANKQDVANLKKAIKGIGMPGLQRKGTLKFEAVEKEGYKPTASDIANAGRSSEIKPSKMTSAQKARARALTKADRNAQPKNKVSLKKAPWEGTEGKQPSYLMNRIQEKANHVPQDETRDSFDKQVDGRRLTKTFNNELESQMTEKEFVDMHSPKNADVPEFTNAPVVHAKTFKSFKDSVKAGPIRSGDNSLGDKNVVNPVNRNT